VSEDSRPDRKVSDKPLTYAAAGVDIAAAAGVDIARKAEGLERAKRHLRSTFTPQVVTDIGAFGAMYSLEEVGAADSLLVASTDSVGTKLMVASMAGRHNTVGMDIVGHCVNDILVQGARPLFFMDYIAAPSLSPEFMEELIEGLSAGCREAGCALIGGETAELPGVYREGEYDLVGFVVGAVSRQRAITGESIRPGDVLLALASNGLHTNGYSLARKAFFEAAGWSIDRHVPEFGCTVGEELLRVHRCYARSVHPLLERVQVKGMAHSSGGEEPLGGPSGVPLAPADRPHRGTGDVPRLQHGRGAGAGARTGRGRGRLLLPHRAGRDGLCDRADRGGGTRCCHHLSAPPAAARGPCDGEPSESSQRNPGCDQAGIRPLLAVSARFSRDGCSLMAAAIAFFGMISLVPLGVVAISVFGRVLGSSAAAEQHITSLLRSIFPLSAPGLEQAIRQFSHPGGRWLVELISVLSLLWAGSRLFLTLEDVLTRVWSGHGRGRPLLIRNLIAFGAMVAAGLIFLVITLLTTAAAAIAARATMLQELGPHLHPMPWLRAFGPPTAAWLAFLLTYKFLPQARARWTDAVIGAAAAAVLWELSRLAFSVLLVHSAGYGKLYGSLAGAVVVSVWLYFSASIMLVGAELAVVLQEAAEKREG